MPPCLRAGLLTRASVLRAPVAAGWTRQVYLQYDCSPLVLVGSLVGHSVLIADCPGAIYAIRQKRLRLTIDLVWRIAAVCPGFCRR